ncbi:MAG: hypothetical protein LBL74_04905 [Bacteroidales bacterium]|nr:hypothetical protein [Bacteroidales bacterium]
MNDWYIFTIGCKDRQNSAFAALLLGFIFAKRGFIFPKLAFNFIGFDYNFAKLDYNFIELAFISVWYISKISLVYI